MGRTTGKFRIFFTIFHDVCCVLHRVYQIVSCQALAEALKQNSSLTDLDLQQNNIGPEGTKAWCLVCSVRMVSCGERV